MEFWNTLEKYGEKPGCNVPVPLDEIEMTSLISPLIQVCDGFQEAGREWASIRLLY